MKVYAIQIGKDKLRELLKNKGGTITHIRTPRWIRLLNKESDFVKFYDPQFYDEATFEIKEVKEVIIAGRIVISVKVKL